jgi:transposase
VLSLPPSVKIFLAPGATDMRKAIDGLSALVRSVLAQDALSGHLFVFCNRRRDRLKILVWDLGGFWLLMKRLEVGTFAWPSQIDGRVVVLTSAELTMLLEGVDLTRLHLRKRYRLEPKESPAVAA